MPEFDGGELQRFDPAQFPYDPEAAAGKCRFAPNCGGVEYKPGKTSRPDYPQCPSAPAEFAERLGMDEATAKSGTGAAAEKRYMPICKNRAERRFGAKAVRETENGAAT